MRRDDFMFECLGYISDSKLYHSQIRRKIRKQKRKNQSPPNVAAIAAIALALAVGGSVPIGISTGVFTGGESDIRYEGGDDEIGSVDEFTMDEKLYNTRDVYVEPQYISNKITTISNDELELKFDIYEIQSIAPVCAVAVRRNNEEDYYIYSNTDYRPETLGRLMEDLSLEENLVIEEIYVRNGDEEVLCEGYDEKEVFDILFEKNTNSLITQKNIKMKRVDIITSLKKLGNIEVVIQISEDGFMHISILEHRMVYVIKNVDELVINLQSYLIAKKRDD